MAHIHTNPGEHDHTASAYILRVDEDETRILLHRHKKLGRLLQFGGHIELTETPWQAILHELVEETGYDVSQLHLLQPPGMLQTLIDADLHPYPLAHNTHDFDAAHKHTDIAYLFVANQAPRGVPKNGESADFVLLTKAELDALPAEEIPENVRQIARFAFSVIDAWDRISALNWGACP